MATVTGLVIAGAIVAFCSLFCFFGPACSDSTSVIPSMFDLCFGNTKSYSGIFVRWYLIGGYTTLFVLQLLIMLGFIGVIFILLSNKKVNKKTVLCSITGLTIMSLVVMIMSFCAKAMLMLGGSTDTSSIGLGVGPIIYSVMYIVVIAILLVAIFNVYKEIKNPSEENQTVAYSYSNSHSSNTNNLDQSKERLSESAKLDLLSRYKKLLDEGTITQEEFDAKKKDLL